MWLNLQASLLSRMWVDEYSVMMGWLQYFLSMIIIRLDSTFTKVKEP